MIDNFGFPPIILCENELNKNIKEPSKERLFVNDITIRKIFTTQRKFNIKEQNNLDDDDMEEVDL